MSKLWYEERPLLRPIKFVRSVETATLFQEAEELLEPTVQHPGQCTFLPIQCIRRKFKYPGADETVESHVPTADKVSRVFSSTHPHLFDNPLFEIEEGIEEVNFEDLALVHERVLNSAPATLVPPMVQDEVLTGGSRNSAPETQVQCERTSGATLTLEAELSDGHMITTTNEATEVASSVRGRPTSIETEATIAMVKPERATIPRVPSPLFIVDTNPSMSQKQILVPAYHIHPHTKSLGENVHVEAEPDPEDDVIVYDAPNPRISTPRVEPSTLTENSSSNHGPSLLPRQINPLRRGKFVHTVGRNARRGSSGVMGVKRKRLAEHKNFAAFGAMIAEARLRSQDGEENKDPKEHLRRQGDSDLDWGDETEEDEKGDGPVSATAEGMDIDPDLAGSVVTVAAMEMFVEGINGNHVTMDDLEDMNTKGDSSSDDGEEGKNEGGSEDDDLESDEERMLMEEFIANQYGSDFSDDDEDELGPMAGFQARLDRLRKKQQKIIEMGDDENEDEMGLDFQWGEGEEIDVCTTHDPGPRDSRAIPRTFLKELSVITRRAGRRATRSSRQFGMDFSMSYSLNHLRQVSCKLLRQCSIVLMIT